MASLSFREEIFVDRLTALCAIKQVEHCTISWLPSGDVRVSGFWDCAPIQGELAATVPAVAAANNRSDEIALRLETIRAMVVAGGVKHIHSAVDGLTDCIAQLRAMR
jgi:hypothetical protein